MVNFDKGQAIKVSSKVLDMCLGLRRSGLASTTSTNTTEEASPAGEESNTMAAIVVEDKALVGATLFTAESGHVARKINLEVCCGDCTNPVDRL